MHTLRMHRLNQSHFTAIIVSGIHEEIIKVPQPRITLGAQVHCQNYPPLGHISPL